MKRISRFLAVLAILLSSTLVNQTAIAQAQANQRPKISIAILLDASNSMDGLIDQARLQIWEIVNTLSKARKNNQIPELEVALYQYGKTDLPPQEGYLQLLTGFTNDLDLVSEKLFSISTDGGQEYAGWVIQAAMQELAWTNNPNNFRVIFIAGNEPFDQGPVPYQEAIAEARKKDTIVNTIYCGSVDDPDRNTWAQGASIAGGNNASINQDRPVTVIPTPYDQPLLEITALPPEMQRMTRQEQRDYLERKQGERRAIQAQIQELSQQRQNFLARHHAHAQLTDTFKYAMLQILRQQLAAKGFTLVE